MNQRGPTRATDGSPPGSGAFLADRDTRRPSARTVQAYRRHFDAIAVLGVGGDEDPSSLLLGNLTIEVMRPFFALYPDSA